MMSLIQALLRRLIAQQPLGTGRTLVPLQPDQLKAVAGGGASTNGLPRGGY
jgi:hypothetical protein